uniref:Uncharacterized protein n=1 Tax=Ciona intestinalis TaxID=7719 RepID=H2XZJ3_CIOIN
MLIHFQTFLPTAAWLQVLGCGGYFTLDQYNYIRRSF